VAGAAVLALCQHCARDVCAGRLAAAGTLQSDRLLAQSNRLTGDAVGTSADGVA
jgi:hypothetical protein